MPPPLSLTSPACEKKPNPDIRLLSLPVVVLVVVIFTVSGG
jgi:hypothetical protein